MVQNEQSRRFVIVANILKDSQIVQSWRELCSLIMYSPQNLNEVFKGNRDVKVAVIASFCTTFSINIGYIMLGEGEIFVTKSENSQKTNIQNHTKQNTTKYTTNNTTKSILPPPNGALEGNVVHEEAAKYGNAPKEQENYINVVIRLNKALIEAGKPIIITLEPE